MNSLNKSLQGRFTTVTDFVDNVQAFVVKLVGRLYQGRKLQHLIAALQNEEPGHGIMEHLVQAHLPSIQKEFQPFSVEVRSLSNNMQKDLLEFVNDSTACDAFEALLLTKFWSKMSELHTCG